MSFEITTAQKQSYGNNVSHLAQQKGSLFRNAVMIEEGVIGTRHAFDQLGQAAARKRQTRHGDTPIMNTPHRRRWCTLFDFEWADLVDNLDKLKTITDMTNPYAQQAGYSLGRSFDDEIITAAFATATTGENGETTAAFDTNNVVAVNSWAFGTGTGNAGLTVSKVIEARFMLRRNLTDPSEEMFLAAGSRQIGNLMATVEATSTDFLGYNERPTLVDGKLTRFMGFNFIETERLPLDGSSFRRCFAWAKSGLGIAIGADVKVDIGERRDKSMATQVYAAMRMGATRVEEAKVIEIKCAES